MGKNWSTRRASLLIIILIISVTQSSVRVASWLPAFPSPSRTSRFSRLDSYTLPGEFSTLSNANGSSPSHLGPLFLSESSLPPTYLVSFLPSPNCGIADDRPSIFSSLRLVLLSRLSGLTESASIWDEVFVIRR